ncbi:helix-turn-helix domain-containing protein [Paracoccus cavernae]|uniref:helix-turn-helix domain-containing protein n=1 Tax=Paracoccus cavernae TaxID=1571207 RepID=UPI0035F349FF
MQTLKSYLQSSKVTQAEFAASVAVKQGTVSKLISGRILPSLKLAQRIDAATGGRVPVGSWVIGAPATSIFMSSPAAPAAPTQEQPHETISS